MKRIGYLYEQIYAWDNLLSAYHKARWGKHSVELDRFEYDWETNLLAIQAALQEESYGFGGYRQFKIFEPKERIISCAPFSDRIVHHAICNIISPILEQSMIVDSYACRKGKGLHKAVRRAFWFYRNTAYHYRLDIRKYFYTIDHQILLSMLNRKFKDIKLLNLLAKLIGTYQTGHEYYFPFPEDDLLDLIRERGLPIGNLTSQWLANYYLSKLDHYIREELHLPYYIRYMDDIIVFSNDRNYLRQSRTKITDRLAELRLNVNERKDHIQSNKQGIDFLGFRLHDNRIKLRTQNLVRFKRKLKAKSSVTVEDFRAFLQSINGHLGFLKGGHTKHIVNRIFDEIYFHNNTKRWRMILT